MAKAAITHLFLVLLSITFLNGCASHTQTSSQNESVSAWPTLDYYQESLKSQYPLKSNARVSVTNHWGDIRIKNHKLGNVAITAAIQRIGEVPPAAPEIALEESVQGVSIVVNYPEASIQPRTGRVDLVVYLPPEVQVQTEALDGFSEIKKTANTVSAQSKSGMIYVVNAGPIAAQSEQGEMYLRPIYPGWDSLTAVSQSGHIVAFLPKSENLSIEVTESAQVSGEIELTKVNDDHYVLSRGTGSDHVALRSGGSIELYHVLIPRDIAIISDTPLNDSK